ncbi:hypothetical protein BH23GEM9_BH23GEM9_30170 [soil metagenome]
MSKVHGTDPDGAGSGDSGADDTLVIHEAEQFWAGATRRDFLRLLGIGGSVVLMPAVFSACDRRTGTVTEPPTTGQPVTLNLGTDTGILNYAFALEQLEAGFYTAVLGSPIFAAMTAEQQEIFTDLRDHEVIHREFLRLVLGSDRIGDLALNQTAVTNALSSIANVLRTTEAFEDLGVSAYNGAGKYLTNAANLLVAGKIVSVEARHAAAIRDLRESMGVSAGTPAGTRFAGDDVVIPSGAAAGLDVKLEPAAVLQRVAATGFVTTQISLGTAPPARPGTNDFGPPSPTP